MLCACLFLLQGPDFSPYHLLKSVKIKHFELWEIFPMMNIIFLSRLHIINVFIDNLSSLFFSQSLTTYIHSCSLCSVLLDVHLLFGQLRYSLLECFMCLTLITDCWQSLLIRDQHTFTLNVVVVI